MNIKVLGPGCFNCKRLEAHVIEAVERLGIQADVEKIEDIADIMAYGIMSTPGLVVDEEVLMAGRVPSIPELTTLIASRMN